MYYDPSTKTPAQRKLASIPQHEAWLAHHDACVALDAAEVAAGSTLRPDREACRAIATSQPVHAVSASSAARAQAKKCSCCARARARCV